MRRIPLGALREREFRLFFSGQLVSLLGDAVTPFALAWAVLDLTGSARDLGFVIAANTAPLVIFLLVGGVFADRLPRRGVMLTADIARMAIQAATGALLLSGAARMERALGQPGRPEGLLELWPGAPLHRDIRILFAVEPPATALLIAVLEGVEVVENQFPEAVMASADRLREVRAGQAPEAAAHTYADKQSFLAEFHPGDAGSARLGRLPSPEI